MDLLLGLAILNFTLGILLSASAGSIWQEKGGSYWAGLAIALLLGFAGFMYVSKATRGGGGS